MLTARSLLAETACLTVDSYFIIPGTHTSTHVRYVVGVSACSDCPIAVVLWARAHIFIASQRLRRLSGEPKGHGKLNRCYTMLFLRGTFAVVALGCKVDLVRVR